MGERETKRGTEEERKKEEKEGGKGEVGKI